MSLADDIEELEKNVKNMKFDRLVVIAGRHFEARKQKGTSHSIYRMPWPGDPRVNLQPSKTSQAKKYQVEQVIKALRKLEEQQLRQPQD